MNRKDQIEKLHYKLTGKNLLYVCIRCKKAISKRIATKIKVNFLHSSIRFCSKCRNILWTYKTVPFSYKSLFKTILRKIPYTEKQIRKLNKRFRRKKCILPKT